MRLYTRVRAPHRLLVEVEGTLRRRSGVGVIFCLFEQLVELALEDLGVGLVLFEGFFEHFTTAGFVAAELLHGFRHVLNGGRLHMLLESDDGAKFRVDVKGGFATRAFHFNEIVFTSSHSTRIQ